MPKRSLLPPKPKRFKAKLPESKLPPKSIFDSEEVSRFAKDSVEVQVNLEVERPVHNLFERSCEINIDEFQRVWDKTNAEYKSEIIQIVAKCYSFVDILAALQKEMIDTKTDPTADLISSGLDEGLNFISTQALLQILGKMLLPEGDFQKEILLQLSQHLIEKKKTPNLFREALGKLNKHAESSSDPYGLGAVVESYKR